MNFPFDLATILISILLLKYVMKRGRFIGIIALLNICVSAILSVILYFVLKITEISLYTTIKSFEQNINPLSSDYFTVEFNNWLTKVSSFVSGSIYKITDFPDLHLLPLLLTTFVPVTLYMSVFLFLSFCKPIMWTSGRVFEIIGSKDESVFKQFGTLMAALIAAIKAIYNYLIAT